MSVIHVCMYVIMRRQRRGSVTTVSPDSCLLWADPSGRIPLSSPPPLVASLLFGCLIRSSAHPHETRDTLPPRALLSFSSNIPSTGQHDTCSTHALSYTDFRICLRKTGSSLLCFPPSLILRLLQHIHTHDTLPSVPAHSFFLRSDIIIQTKNSNPPPAFTHLRRLSQ